LGRNIEQLSKAPTLGSSILQSSAANFRTSVVYPLDTLPAWVYYFDSFEQGALSGPELGINIPVGPKSLLGLNGKCIFRGAVPHTRTRSSISFYCYYSVGTFPNFFLSLRHCTMPPSMHKILYNIPNYMFFLLSRASDSLGLL
jgi:hypothetical protein